MKKERGFTLIELMVVVAIMGILGATAMPLFNIWRQRAYGSEAVVMMKQLSEGQILYYLEHDDFFPPKSEGTYTISSNGDQTPNDAVAQIREKLNLLIPTSQLDYSISNTGDSEKDSCLITISSPENNFPLFKNGQTYIMGVLNSDGDVTFTSYDGLFPYL